MTQPTTFSQRPKLESAITMATQKPISLKFQSRVKVGHHYFVFSTAVSVLILKLCLFISLGFMRYSWTKMWSNINIKFQVININWNTFWNFTYTSGLEISFWRNPTFVMSIKMVACNAAKGLHAVFISQWDRDKLCAAMWIGSDDYCSFVRLKAEFPLTN